MKKSKNIYCDLCYLEATSPQTPVITISIPTYRSYHIFDVCVDHLKEAIKMANNGRKGNLKSES